jgi:multidrug efflux pump subunit AcrA (membrane-fusion protein)
LDAAPRAKLSLKEEGLPRLLIKQDARLFFAAFPYQRYGSVTGTVVWVSPAAVTEADGRHFVALVSMNQDSIKVDNKPRPLLVGMEGEARIVVGQRLLIEYAFEPLQKLRENLRN